MPWFSNKIHGHYPIRRLSRKRRKKLKRKTFICGKHTSNMFTTVNAITVVSFAVPAIYAAVQKRRLLATLGFAILAQHCYIAFDNTRPTYLHTLEILNIMAYTDLYFRAKFGPLVLAGIFAGLCFILQSFVAGCIFEYMGFASNFDVLCIAGVGMTECFMLWQTGHMSPDTEPEFVNKDFDDLENELIEIMRAAHGRK